MKEVRMKKRTNERRDTQVGTHFLPTWNSCQMAKEGSKEKEKREERECVCMCVAENEQVSTLATSDYDFHDGTLITSCQLHSDGESIQVERGRPR